MRSTDVLSKSNNFIDIEFVKKLEKKIYGLFEESVFLSDHLELLEPEVIRDFARMGACLTPPVVIKQLKKLSTLLESHLKEKGLLQQTDNGVEIIKKPGKDYVSNYKVLTPVLEGWAQKNGFNQGGYEPCITDENKFRQLVQLPSSSPKLFDLVNPSTFRSVLQRLGYLFKDVGVPFDHGEFTHIWQIYVIVEQNKEQPFLKYTPLYLYKKLGSFPYVPFLIGEEKTIWDIIFDDSDTKNFNMPEFLNEMLRGGITTSSSKPSDRLSSIKDNISILSQIINGRYEKRFQQFQNGAAMLKDKIEKKNISSGLIINNSIFFKSQSKELMKLTFDGIKDEISYYPYIEKLYRKPKTPDGLPFIEKLYAIFDPKNWSEKHPESNANSRKILKTLMDDYEKDRSFRSISSILTQYFLGSTDKTSYLSYLINHAQGMLFYHDKHPPKVGFKSKNENPMLDSENKKRKFGL